jgi:hypothetical protein
MLEMCPTAASSLTKELAADGIRVNAISHSFVEPIWRDRSLRRNSTSELQHNMLIKETTERRLSSAAR